MWPQAGTFANIMSETCILGVVDLSFVLRNELRNDYAVKFLRLYSLHLDKF